MIAKLFTHRRLALSAAAWLLLLAVLPALAVHPARADVLPTAPVPQPSNFNGLYFSETGHTLAEPLLGYWHRYGGLAQFGYPLTEPFMETNARDGRQYLVQYFERARFEHHPENSGTEYEVLLGLLGRHYHPPDPAAAPLPGEIYFSQTGHNLGGVFLDYWQAHGGLFVNGYPITEQILEVNPLDGRSYTVQYFERSRFEWHPEHAGTPFEVLLGHLGRQLLNDRGWLQGSTEPTGTPVVAAPTATSTPAPALQSRIYGVLQNDGTRLADQHARGIRLKTLELGWNLYEPWPGQWNERYILEKRAEYHALREAGFGVVLDLGLQYPPAWAADMEPFVNQYGEATSGRVNAIWNRQVRAHVGAYIGRIFADFGSGFWGVRLGSGASPETLYPPNPEGRRWSYWAFGPSALAGNPAPGWRPGDPSPNGEAERFFSWYLGALAGYVNWQQAEVRKHYPGYLLQLMPGQGVRPGQYDRLIEANLVAEGRPIFGATEGAVWDRVVAAMANRANVVAYCSSLADDSGIDEESSFPEFWSAAHWLASVADAYGMPKMGENPGGDSFETMQKAFEQMDRFGYMGLFWMSERQLYDTSGRYATIDQYQQLIERYR